MSRNLTLALVVAALFLGPAVPAFAKKTKTEPATATTQATTKESKGKADKDDEEDEVEMHKSRAKEVSGKALDKEKTAGQVGKITSSVGTLTGKIQNPAAKPAAKDDDDDAPAARRKKRTASTQPTTQEAKKAEPAPAAKSKK